MKLGHYSFSKAKRAKMSYVAYGRDLDIVYLEISRMIIIKMKGLEAKPKSDLL